MAVSISTLSVKLTANTLSFAQNMAKAAQPLASFGSSVLKIGSILTGFGAALAGLAAGGSLVALVNGSFASIDALNDQAVSLGINTKSLSQLTHAANLAGGSQELLVGSLQKMNKNLAEAASGSGPAADALRTLGLDGQALANMPVEEAFIKIAQAMKGVENPAQRTSLAMDLFGKSGASLIPMLNEGEDGIRGLMAEADKLGVSFDAIEANKVAAANDAMDRMKLAIQGAANALAIQLAPFIETASTKLLEFVNSGETGLRGKLVAGFEAVVGAIAYASDYLQLLPAGFYGFRAGALQAIAGVLGGIDTLGSGLVKLMNLLPGVSVEWTDTFSTLRQGMEQIAAEEAGKMNDALGKFQRGDNAASVAKLFEDIRQKSTDAAKSAADNAQKMGGAFKGMEEDADGLQKVSDKLADIRNQVQQFGMTDSQKKLADLKAMGASPEQIAEAEANLKKLSDLDAQKKAADDLQSRAKQVFEDTRTPMEKYEEKVGELSDLLNAGAIDWTTYGRAIQKARGELEGKDKVPDAPTLDAPELIQSGSAQAARFAYDFSRGQQNLSDKGDPAKAQLAETKDANRILERIARNTAQPTDSTLEVVDL